MTTMTNIRSIDQVAFDGVRTAWRAPEPCALAAPAATVASIDGVVRVRRVSFTVRPSARNRVLPIQVLERMRQTMEGIRVPSLGYRA